MRKKYYAAIISSVLAILIGLGFMIYPKATDWNYALSQMRMETAGGSARAAVKVADENISIPEGVVCRLLIPKISLRTNVLSGTGPEILKKGAGHYEETPLPGEKGNCAIAGHRTMHGHPFRYLDDLIRGDEIIIYTADGKHVYRVTEKKVVKPTDLSVIAPSEEAKLTLTACHPVGSARQRLVVVAQLEED